MVIIAELTGLWHTKVRSGLSTRRWSRVCVACARVRVCVCVTAATTAAGAAAAATAAATAATSTTTVTTGRGGVVVFDGDGDGGSVVVHRTGSARAFGCSSGALPDRQRRRRRVHGREQPRPGTQWVPWETNGSRSRPRPLAFWLATGRASAPPRTPRGLRLRRRAARTRRRRRRPLVSLYCFFSRRPTLITNASCCLRRRRRPRRRLNGGRPVFPRAATKRIPRLRRRGLRTDLYFIGTS